MTLEGAKVRKAERAELAIPALPEPALPAIDGTYNIVVTGVGGTGVVTIGALIAMAAHLEGLGAGEMEMAGLAQKGGAVHIHCRIAAKPSDISAIRVAVGEADAVIGGDLVVTAGAKTLGLMTRGRTRAVVNAHEIPTGDFTRDRGFRLPTDRMTLALRARIGDDALRMLDASRLAERLLGDAIYANVLMLGAAWQAGLVPLSEEALRRAIEINGASVAGNLEAFTIGRWAIADPAAALAAAGGAAAEAPAEDDLDAVVERRAEHLVKYQGERLARRYRARVEAARAIDPELAMAVAKGYHKLLSYKDEYEVARLHDETLRAAVDAQFTDVRRMRFHLAPPILGGEGADGRPRKRSFGPWMLGAFGLLRRFKVLRGTPFDPFGYGADRRLERALIAEYERDMDRVQAAFTPATRDVAMELAGAAARDPRLRPGEGGGGRGGGGAARGAAGGAGGRRMAEGAGGGVGGGACAGWRSRRRCWSRPARAGCRWSGRRWCRAAASTRCRARPRSWCAPSCRRRPASGARWSAPAARWCRASTPPSSSPRRGSSCRTSGRSRPRSRVDCTAGELAGSGTARIVTTGGTRPATGDPRGASTGPTPGAGTAAPAIRCRTIRTCAVVMRPRGRDRRPVRRLRSEVEVDRQHRRPRVVVRSRGSAGRPRRRRRGRG